MASSQIGAIVERAPARAEQQEVRLSLPETTMFIIGSSGVLWMLIYGGFKALFSAF